MEAFCYLLSAYFFICIVRVVLSWLDIGEGGVLSMVGTVCYTLTEPLYGSIRKFLPTPGDLPIDLAPMVVIVLLGMFRQILC